MVDVINIYQLLISIFFVLVEPETRVGKPVLNWAKRHKIALGIARGLAHLHTSLETPITHGNVRSKNVLVDDFFVARLTEFGLDKLMKLLHFPKLKVARHLNYRG